MKNGHVLHLYVTPQPRDVNQTSVKLKEHLNTDHPCAADFYYPIKKLVEEGLEKVRTHTDGKQMTRFKNICAEKFSVLHVCQIPTLVSAILATTPKHTVSEQELVTLNVEEPVMPMVSKSPVKTRRIAACGNYKILRSSLKTCIQQKNELKQSSPSNIGRKRKRTSTFKPKYLNAKLDHREAAIQRLKQKLAASEIVKLNNEIANLNRTSNANKKKLRELEDKLKNANKDRTNELKELETDYQHRILLMEEELESLKSDCAKACDLKKMVKCTATK